MRRWRAMWAMALAGGFLAGSAGAATYWVATTGSDSNAGTYSNPWATIQKAASTMSAGDTTYIRGGTYYEAVRLPYSGSSGSPISFIGCEGEFVKIVAGEKLTGWTSGGGNKYYRSLGYKPRQVFVDDTQLIPARWPNMGSAHWLTAPTKTVDSAVSDTQVNDSELTQATNYWVGGRIHIVPGAAWTAWTSTITASGSGYVQFSSLGIVGNPSYDSWARPEAGDEYFIFDCYNALDANGEWWYDSTNQRLWIICPDGGNPSGRTVEVQQYEYGVTTNDGLPKDHVRFRRIKFQGASLGLPGSDYNEISGCMFNYHFYDDNCAGWGSDIYDSGVNYLGGASHYNAFVHNQVGWSSDNGLVMEGNNNVVRSNEFCYTGYMGAGGISVRLRGANAECSHNQLFMCGYSAIHPACTASTISYNDISYVMQINEDGGGIYLFGHDGVWSTFSYNRIIPVSTNDRTWGIYLDCGCQRFYVHHNLVYSCGAYGSGGIVFNGAGDGIPRTTNCWSISNTIYGSAGNGNSAFQDQGDYNKVYNLIAESFSYRATTDRGTNYVSTTDPGWVDAANGDFRLQSTSSCRDTGTHFSGITDGYVGSAPDKGAFEYGAADWTDDLGIRPADMDRYLNGDYDGDGTADLAVWRPNAWDYANARFVIRKSSNNQWDYREHGGIHSWCDDVPVVGDFDGDGTTDKAIYRRATGYWYVVQSSNGQMVSVAHGGYAGDIPLVGDSNGDGKDDYCIVRLESGYYHWYIVYSGGGGTNYYHGGTGDTPFFMYYDADSKCDPSLIRLNNNGVHLDWHIIQSSNWSLQSITYGWLGTATDCLGDYDGDGRTDITVVDTSQSTYVWYIRRSMGGSYTLSWGAQSANAIPVAGADWNGDGKDDALAISPGIYSYYQWKSPATSATGAAWFGNYMR